jgi:hypothetical protein
LAPFASRRLIVRSVVCFSALAALACGCRNGPDAADSESRLQLEERFAITVSDSVPLIGVIAEDSGRLVTWSRKNAYLLSVGEAPRRVPVRFSGVPAGAAIGAGDTLEFVDPAAGVLRRTGMAGNSTVRPLPSGLRVADAVRTERFGWITGGVDAAGRYRIQPLDGSAWWVIRPDTLRDGVLPAYRLAATHDGVLVTEAEPPFRTWRVRPEGAGEPFAPTSAGAPESSGIQRWVSSPVVDLGDAMIQTLSDLASDRRVLVLYDREGREQRKTVISVPMALVGITGDGRYLVGVRDLGKPEVVLYGWRWSNDSDQGAEP